MEKETIRGILEKNLDIDITELELFRHIENWHTRIIKDERNRIVAELESSLVDVPDMPKKIDPTNLEEMNTMSLVIGRTNYNKAISDALAIVLNKKEE